MRRSSGTQQFNHFERRELFREMALAELRFGDDHDWRRKRLVQFAAKMQLSAVEAGRLMQEAQRELAWEAKLAPKLEAGHLKYIPVAGVATRHPPLPKSGPGRFIWAGLLLITAGIALRWLH